MSRLLACTACIGAALALAGCDSNDSSREPLPDWGDGFEDPANATPPNAGAVYRDDAGTPIHLDAPEDSFALVVAPEVEHPIRLGLFGDVERDCAIAQQGEENDITCILEVDELDLWVLGLAFDVLVPEGMCDFLHYWSYIYANFEWGVGPTEVSWTDNGDGTFSDEVNASNGEPFCEFDYRKQFTGDFKPPNCCLGGYVQRVKDGETGKVSTSTGEWGGKRGDCFDGAGYIDEMAVIGADGFPLATYVYLNRRPHLEPKRYDGVSGWHPANIPLANYWRSSDHNGGMPAALSDPLADPYYEFYCEDDAKEEIAHIRLVVREWNEEAEFDRGGDPDSEGTEPGWDTPLNDIADWRDVTPDDSSYPQYVEVR